MQPRDLLVGVFIEKFDVGDTFEEWPLHVTLVPWFRLETAKEQFIRKLKKELAPIKPFTDTAGEREIFSKREANVLDKRKWQTLHEAVLACVYNTAEPAARQFRFVAEAFQPHVTVQPDGGLRAGESVEADVVYVVEQRGDYKQVVETINL